MDVFISYARHDVKAATRLNKVLEGLGFSVWRDVEALRAGEDFEVEITEALSNVASVIVLWSAAAAESHWVRLEASEAIRQGKLVLVRIDGADLSDGLESYHAEDLSHWRGSLTDPALRRIRQRITALSGRHVMRRLLGFADILANRSANRSLDGSDVPLGLFSGSSQIWELLGVRLDRFILVPMVMATLFAMSQLLKVVPDNNVNLIYTFFVSWFILFFLRIINFVSVPKISRTTQLFFSREFAWDCFLALVGTATVMVLGTNGVGDLQKWASINFFPTVFIAFLSIIELVRGLIAFTIFLMRRMG